MKTLLLAILSLSLSLIPLGGCAADDDAALIDACEANCAHVGAAANCPASVANEDVAECQAGCAVIVKMYTDDCKAALEEVYLCSMSEQTYRCDDGSDLAYSEDEGCEDEYEAYGLACYQ